MRTVGIVCEYNPFHRGHQYLIGECRRLLGEDAAVICALSGDFVQRGEAAFFDKFTRAEAACRCGADLVLELPLPWCLRSAEGFAAGAVAMLRAAGCDVIAFGSESGDLAALERLASFALDPAAISLIHERMDRDKTLSFACARQQAARELVGAEASLLSGANDILAVEYLKAIRKSGAGMQPVAVKRKGGGHDSLQGGEFCSAMQLRQRIDRGEEVSAFIPQEALAVVRRAAAAGKTGSGEHMEIALLSRLYGLGAEDFEKLPDAGGGAGRRLFKALQAGGSLEEIAAAACTKRYTTARMRRMLLCAAFGICAEDTKGEPPYLRVLAASERGRELLRRKSGDKPFITRPSTIRRLAPQGVRTFGLGSYAHDLYRLCCTGAAGFRPDEDWRKRPIIV